MTTPSAQCRAGIFKRPHRFEPRFDRGETLPNGSYTGMAGGMERILEAQASKTYVRDICVRCGQTIERAK